jgi:hypothetical protein
VLSAKAQTVRSIGPDGPRPGAGAAPRLDGPRLWLGRSVMVQSVFFLLYSRPRSHLIGGTPSGRRHPRVCLGIGRLVKTPLVDEEPKRGEDLR